MSKKLKIYFICGAGLGSSLASQMVAEEVLKSEGFEEYLEHESISSTPGLNADIIVSAENFKSQFEKTSINENTKMVYLYNIVDSNEIKEKLIPAIRDLSS